MQLSRAMVVMLVALVMVGKQLSQLRKQKLESVTVFCEPMEL